MKLKIFMLIVLLICCCNFTFGQTCVGFNKNRFDRPSVCIDDNIYVYVNNDDTLDVDSQSGADQYCTENYNGSLGPFPDIPAFTNLIDSDVSFRTNAIFDGMEWIWQTSNFSPPSINGELTDSINKCLFGTYNPGSVIDFFEGSCDGYQDSFFCQFPYMANANFELSGITAKWMEAKEMCEDNSKNLVTIPDVMTKQDFAEFLIAQDFSESLKFWVGMKVNDEGKLTWCGQEYSPYRNWCPGQPAVTNDKQCVAYQLNENEDTGCLTVDNCNTKFYYVCQPKRCDMKKDLFQMVNVLLQEQRSIRSVCRTCGNHIQS